jgi:hypothetical protein
MEEKKNKEQSAKKAPKLTYEQLEAYAAQTTEQAKKIFQENQMLKRALYEQNLKEIELAIKCLDHPDKFSEEFIKAVIARIEEVMNPDTNKEDKEQKEEK